MARFGLAGAVLAGHRLFDVGDRSHIGNWWRSNMNTRPASRRRWGISAFTALAAAGLTISLTTPMQAAPITNLIQNPGFVSTNSHTTQIQVNTSQPANGPTFTNGADLGPWTASGLVFLFGPGGAPSMTNADKPPGAPNFFGPTGGFCLWGPSSTTCGGANANGLTIGPSGGNFLVLDGAMLSDNVPPVNIRGSISQTITGLHVNVPVTVDFEWAAGQQAGFQGMNTEQVQVSLCPQSGCSSGDTLLTPVVMNQSRGFVPWMVGKTETGGAFTFTPTATTEVLSFLAIGTPATGTGAQGPPMVLLDGGVSGEPVPEPATWTQLGISFLSIAGFAYRCRKSVFVPDKAEDA